MSRETLFDRLVSRATTSQREQVEGQVYQSIDAIHALQQHPQIYKKGVADTLQHGAKFYTTERENARLGVNFTTRIIPTEVLSPQWLSRRGVIQAASELSARSLWEQVLVDLPGSTPRMSFAEEKDIDPMLLARFIATNNSGFFNAAITMGMLAAADGRWTKYIPRSSVHFLNNDFAIAIGEKYVRRAKSYEEFENRLREIVPNPDTYDPEGPDTLYSMMSLHGAFKSVRGSNMCPAKFLTSLTMQEWGKQLDTNKTYRDRLRHMLEN